MQLRAEQLVALLNILYHAEIMNNLHIPDFNAIDTAPIGPNLFGQPTPKNSEPKKIPSMRLGDAMAAAVAANAVLSRDSDRAIGAAKGQPSLFG